MNKVEPLDNALIVAGNKNQPFVVSFSEYKGRRLLDVRKHYLEKDSGETKPTRKGVSLNRIQFEILHNLFNEKRDEIEDWFCLDETDKTKELKAIHDTRNNQKMSEIEFDTWMGLDMFRYRRIGQESVLQLNTRHSWVQRFKEQFDSSDEKTKTVVNLTLQLIDSLYCSISLIDPMNEKATEIMETVLGNWGIFSKRSK